MTIKLHQLSSRLHRVFLAIILTLVLFPAAIAKAHTPTPEITASPKKNAETNPCPAAWHGLIERFTITSAQPSLPLAGAGTVAGTRMTELPRFHVPINTPISDISNPPTSGSHYECTAPWGIYEESPADGFLVHNLEHGTVIMSYNPDRIKGLVLARLRAQARELSLSNARLILTPRPTLNAAIALTAWGYLQKLDRYDPAAVNAFYQDHIARGPECENGRCPEW